MRLKNLLLFIKNKHLLSLAGNLSATAISFITFGMLARVLTKAVFGDWLTFLTAFTFLEMFRTSTIQTPLIKFFSGAHPEKAQKVAGAAWDLSARITLVFCILNAILFLIFRNLANAGWLLFLQWFAVVYVCSLPFNYATWLLQAREKFGAILVVRVVNNGSFLVFLLCFLLARRLDLSSILYSYIASCLITSVLCIIKGWSPLSGIFNSDKESGTELFGMGKYIMITGVSSNLLKSSDTFILNFMLGPQAVAIYTTPQKVIEIIDLPLRSIVATAIPSMATELNRKNEEGVGKVLMKYSGMITWALIPAVVFVLIFAEPIVTIIGGKGYASSANILRIFIVFAALLPIDRFLGVTLDIIGKPAMNLIKVILMLSANIAGDFVGISLFHNVASVAASSILTFLVGIIFGHFVLRNFLPYTFSGIFSTGFTEVKALVLRFWNKAFAAKQDLPHVQDINHENR